MVEREVFLDIPPDGTHSRALLCEGDTGNREYCTKVLWASRNILALSFLHFWSVPPAVSFSLRLRGHGGDARHFLNTTHTALCEMTTLGAMRQMWRILKASAGVMRQHAPHPALFGSIAKTKYYYVAKLISEIVCT